MRIEAEDILASRVFDDESEEDNGGGDSSSNGSGADGPDNGDGE